MRCFIDARFISVYSREKVAIDMERIDYGKYV